MHRVILVRVRLRDVRQERIGRALEEAVIVEGTVVIEHARERPILPIDRAREALQRVLDLGARLELVEERREVLAGHGPIPLR